MDNPFEIMVAELREVKQQLVDLNAKLDSYKVVEDEKMNIEQAAAYLGVSTSTVYKKVRSEKIPHTKHLGRLYFFKPSLQAYLKQV